METERFLPGAVRAGLCRRGTGRGAGARRKGRRRPCGCRGDAHARLREVESIAGVALWEFDVATGIVTASPRFFAMLGEEPSAHISLDAAVRRWCHPDDEPRLREVIAKACGDGAPYSLDLRVVSGRTGVRWLHARGQGVRDGRGRVVHLFGTVLDITERKRAELELEASRAQLRGLLRQSNCLLWQGEVREGFPNPAAEWNPPPLDEGRGTVLHWDIRVENEEEAPSWLPVERTEGETLADAWLRSRDPEDEAHAARTARDAFRTGLGRYTQTFRNHMADGSVRWVQEDVRIEPLPPQSTGLTEPAARPMRRWRVTGLVTDVTERERAERELEDRKSELREVMERANCLLWRAEVAEVADLSLCSDVKPPFDPARGTALLWHLSVVNEAEVLRWLPIDKRAGESFSRAWTRVRHPGDRLACNVRSGAALSSGADRYSQTFRTLLADGTACWLQEDVRIEPLGSTPGPDGAPAALRRWRLTGVCVDVSEVKRLQEQVLRVKKLASLGELVAGIAHEVNNPLAAIAGHAQLLQMHPDRAVRADAETIDAMANRASRIVRSLLSFARQGGGEGERRRVDVNALAGTSLDLVRTKLRRADVELVADLTPDPAPVSVHETQVEQALVNLLNNAVHALEGRRGGRVIRLRTAVEVAEVMEAAAGSRAPVAAIYVSDNGAGMTPEVAGRIFDPFFTTKDVGEGTGLGLSICHGILEAHGGAITLVRSAPGEGSTFRVALPLVAPGD